MIRISKKNKLLIILLFLTVLNCIIILNKSNAASASISASSTTVNVNQPVTITGKVTAASWEVTLSGDGNSKKITDSSEDASNTTKTVSITYTPKTTGSKTFTLTGLIWDESSGTSTKDATTVNKTCTITVTGNNPTTSTKDDGDDESKITSEGSKSETNKSRNNYLSSLKVSDGTLSPEFNRDITSYTINFDDENTIKNLDKIKITATADDKTAKVTGTGEKALVEGENTFKINVKSESGSTRTYVIKVTKPATIKESDLRLSSLKVQTVDNEGNSADAELDKAFDKETLEYSMNVESNISGLNVTAIPATTDIDVSISGNENLHDGMNEVVITLTSKEDQTVQTTYKITVNKAQSTLLINESNQGSLENNNSRKNKMIALIICCVIFVVIILLIIWYKKGKHSTISKEKFEKNMNHNFVDDDDVIVDDFDETEESSVDERKHKKNKKGKHEEQESDLESSREESKNNEKEDKNNLNQKLEVQKDKDKEEETTKDNKKDLEDKSEIKKNTKTENKENKKTESKNDLDKKFDVKTKQKKNGGKHF